MPHYTTDNTNAIQIRSALPHLKSSCCAVEQHYILMCQWLCNAVLQIYPGAKEEPRTGFTSSGLFFSCSADSTVRMWRTEPDTNPANCNLLSSVSLLFSSVILSLPVTQTFAHRLMPRRWCCITKLLNCGILSVVLLKVGQIYIFFGPWVYTHKVLYCLDDWQRFSQFSCLTLSCHYTGSSEGDLYSQ